MGAESPKDECGLFGVWAPGEDVARLTYFGLFAQQHRGQESAGIAVSDGTNILVYKDLGLVSQVFNEATLTTLHGDLAIGHTRYSTTGSTHVGERAARLQDRRRALDRPRPQREPGQHPRAGGARRAPGHGHHRHRPWSRRCWPSRWPRRPRGRRAAGPADARRARSASCSWTSGASTRRATRYGIRPLSIGRLPNGFVLRLGDLRARHRGRDAASATWSPASWSGSTTAGLHSARFAETPRPALCIFEFVYLARADSRMRAGPCTRRGARWAASSPRRPRSRRTW